VEQIYKRSLCLNKKTSIKSTIFEAKPIMNKCMKRFAIFLSGCGVSDGAEIHEAVMTMLAIDKFDCSYDIFAPDIPQAHVINHLTGEVSNEKRNVLVEAARIARGKIINAAEFEAGKYDALIFPGGFGVAKNFCTYAFDGVKCSVNPIIEKAIKDMHMAGKPIGAMCISPVLITRVLGQVTTTIGTDPSTAHDLEKMGGYHIESSIAEVVSDRVNKIFTTPCYMLNSRISEIALGAENLIKTILNFIQ
jgi:enhancing lycopene biosynthesis protein 2